MGELFRVVVRDGYWLHLANGGVHPPGTELQFTADQVELYAHQIEVIHEISSEPKKVTPKTSKEVKPNDVA